MLLLSLACAQPWGNRGMSSITTCPLAVSLLLHLSRANARCVVTAPAYLA